MGFVDAIKTCFSRYASFSGRATRSEYWWWVLFVVLGLFVLLIIILVWRDRRKHREQITENLRQYCLTYLRQGYTAEMIRQGLLKYGYKEKDVARALERAQRQ